MASSSCTLKFLWTDKPDHAFSHAFAVADATVLSVKQTLHANWPPGVTKAKAAADIRLIAAGQKLENDKRLADYREFVIGGTTVVHVPPVVVGVTEPKKDHEMCSGCTLM